MSQPTASPEQPNAYFDNPNVLYEAGVFQGPATDPTSRGQNWMLLRERDSPEAPFDITTVNTLMIPRDDDGNLLERDFEVAVQARLDQLIG